VVKCRPPENRDPFQCEVDACIGFLHRQIKLIKPEVIVALGAVSAMHLLKLESRISKSRGIFQDFDGIKVMPTYHPAYLLRNESKKRDVWEDLKKVMAMLGKTR
jgi:DNA polymerase